MTSRTLGRGTLDGRPSWQWCLIASACALLSVAFAPTVLATPVTLDDYDYWGSIGLEDYSDSSFTAGEGYSTLSAPPVLASNSLGTSSVSGYVWMDLNGDGQKSSGEWGLPNVLVWLLSIDSPGSNWHVFTDVNGLYQFQDVPSGWYELQKIHPDTLIAGEAVPGLIHVNGGQPGQGIDPNGGQAVNCDVITMIYLSPDSEALAYSFSLVGYDPQYVSKRLLMGGFSLYPISPPLEPPPLVVPEPGTIGMLATFMLAMGVGAWHRRRRRIAAP